MGPRQRILNRRTAPQRSAARGGAPRGRHERPRGGPVTTHPPACRPNPLPFPACPAVGSRPPPRPFPSFFPFPTLAPCPFCAATRSHRRPPPPARSPPRPISFFLLFLLAFFSLSYCLFPFSCASRDRVPRAPTPAQGGRHPRLSSKRPRALLPQSHTRAHVSFFFSFRCRRPRPPRSACAFSALVSPLAVRRPSPRPCPFSLLLTAIRPHPPHFYFFFFFGLSLPLPPPCTSSLRGAWRPVGALRASLARCLLSRAICPYGKQPCSAVLQRPSSPFLSLPLPPPAPSDADADAPSRPRVGFARGSRGIPSVVRTHERAQSGSNSKRQGKGTRARF